MKRAILLFLSCVFSIALLTTGCGPATMTGYESEPIITTGDPQQETVAQPLAWSWKISGGEFSITAVAKYQVNAIVMSRVHYSAGWQGALAPVDLVLAWGQLTDPSLRKYIAYSQSNRWYYYRYEPGCPVTGEYIGAHSSNHHLIPATANIRTALEGIKRADIIRLDGYLVNLRGKYHDGEYWWNTSTSRFDTGNGACELMLVEKARIGNKVFQ